MSKQGKMKEKEWPIELFRFTESDGWQKQVAGPLAASPRKDCIVIPALRQKFTLRNGEEKSSVFRRDRNLLLVSRRRTRAMLLQFKTRADCLEFSDRFQMLNDGSNATANQQNSTKDVAEPASQREREEVVSYIAQLLHNEDFLSFVGKIEDYIDSSSDGAKILEGLKQDPMAK